MITAFVRTIILYFLIVVGMRLMGKRQIGELQLSEFVAALLLSELASLPITDRDIPLLHGLVPIVVIASMEVVISFVNRKCPRFRRWIIGEPIVLVRNGKIVEANLTKARITPDEVEAQIRIDGYESIKEVKTVILEETGKMSVLPKTPKN